jgi:NDP-4-keto-2,6-dideoxyhexose 3-C-methyltransferase
MKNITKCRICGEKDFNTVMDIGVQHLTGVFPREGEENVASGPVELIQCASSNGCGLVQLRQSYDLDDMYGMNYGYRSGLNSSMVEHLQSKVVNILSKGLLKKGDLVVDIGSNDATTLLTYPQDQYKLVGIDPTGVKFASYYPDNIKLISEFFDASSLNEHCSGKKAKVITSFSMFYDLEDPIAFAKDIESSLEDEGVWIFEQSYLPTMLKTNSFDTICHEHLEFYALKQINWIAKEAGLKVLDVEFNDINGGSFSITASKIESSHEVNQELLDKILDNEKKLGLNSEKAFEDFKCRVYKEKDALMDFLKNASKDGKRVCGMGASTKGNVLLQYYNIDSSLLAEIGEVNSDKFSCFTPGSHIPIVSEDEMLESNPDYILVLPWHFKSFFESLPKLKGKTLVYPLPKFEIVKI